MFAAEAADAVHSAGWFLEHAWLIPVIPALSFFLTILFGKKMPKLGAEFGITALLASLTLSLGTAVQWIQRVSDSHGEGHGGEAIRAIGKSLSQATEVEEHLVAPGPVIKAWTWWQSGGRKFSIGTHVDGLSVSLIVVVALISTLIHIYSVEYVRGDRRFTHFFAALNLFTAAMLNMVLAESTVQFLLGWEIMGLCSFMLIGHWWEEYPNARAAMKAFFTTRTGDIGLLVGLSTLYFTTDTFSIVETNARVLAGDLSSTAITVAAVALFIAVIGKSGQFPLHTWLPDAMAGPTPVSALLHSSTMVVAGVYLVARLYGVFWEGFNITGASVNLGIIIGAITIIIAALLAFVQHDIKKVLAYSTVSQLGYMIMGLSAGAWLPAVFHIFTHAWFKALLFLAAGSVAHSGSHHSFDMKKDMGGLRKHMPITFATWCIGTVALAGIFPLAGFWSKDEILANTGANGYEIFMYIGLMGAFLTPAYMMRATYLTFFGKARGAAAGEHHDEHDAHAPAAHAPAAHGAHASAHDTHAPAHAAAHDTHDAHGGHDDHGASHGPHESPWLITMPLFVLGFLSIVAGWLQMPWSVIEVEKFKEWVEPAGNSYFPSLEEPYYVGQPILQHAPFHASEAILSVAIALAGFAVSFLVCRAVYEKGFLRGLTKRNTLARGVYGFLWNKYYLDALYEKVIVQAIAHPIAKGFYWVNQNILDGIVNGVATIGKSVSRWVYRNIDQKGIDGAVNGAGSVSSGTGGLLRGLQSGKVQQYGALLFGAAAVGALILVVTVSGS
jgi:NADH-quinone oxidoreductase subunit L